MRKLLLGCCLFALVGAAQAADNTVIVTPGIGVTMRSKDIGAGVEAMMPIISDTSGNAIYGTAGAANANVLTIQGVASMTAVKVDGSAVTQPVSGAFFQATQPISAVSLPLPTGAALEAGNLATIAGSITATVAQDNVKQINGVTVLMGNGVTGTGSQRVTIASDNTAFTVNAAESGTWNITNVSGTISLPTGAATSAKQPALGTAGLASTDVITIQGIASMTKLLVTPDSVALPANQSVNVSQINGVTPLMGNGVTGTGSQRVTIASDNTAFSVNAVQSGTWNIGTVTTLPALPANQSVNIAQINGVTPLMGNGVTGTGSPRVTLSSDNSALPAAGQGATGAAAPSGATQMGALTGDATTGGHMKAPISCDNHVFKHITSATDTLAVQGVVSQTIYVCGWRSRAAGTATWYLENTASTNANCSSSNTQLTGVASEIANSGETMLAPFWTGLKNTVSNGLCINSTGTGGVDVDVFYTIF